MGPIKFPELKTAAATAAVLDLHQTNPRHGLWCHTCLMLFDQWIAQSMAESEKGGQ